MIIVVHKPRILSQRTLPQNKLKVDTIPLSAYFPESLPSNHHRLIKEYHF